MNRLLLLTIFAAALFCITNTVTAQKDSTQLNARDTAKTQISGTNSTADDDDFAPGLLFGVIIIGGIVAGAAIVGCIAAALLMVFIAILISAGIFSASVLAGFYKRSVSAGFKTFIILISTLGGIVIGSAGLYVVKKIFSLHMSSQNAFLFGGGGGLLGGLLMGWIIYKMVIVLFGFLKKKLQLA